MYGITPNTLKSELLTDAVDHGEQEMWQKRKKNSRVEKIEERKGDNGDDYQCTGWFVKTGNTGMHFRYDIILRSEC